MLFGPSLSPKEKSENKVTLAIRISTSPAITAGDSHWYEQQETLLQMLYDVGMKLQKSILILLESEFLVLETQGACPHHYLRPGITWESLSAIKHMACVSW